MTAQHWFARVTTILGASGGMAVALTQDSSPTLQKIGMVLGLLVAAAGTHWAGLLPSSATPTPPAKP